MERFALRKIVSSVCDDYIDTLLTGIEENEDDFPYTIACSNFIDELKKKNIIVDIYNQKTSQITLDIKTLENSTDDIRILTRN